MSEGLRIAFLCDHPEHIDSIAKWLFTEWGQYKPDTTLDTVAARLRRYLNKDNIPITIIAFAGGTIVGTATLRQSDLRERKNLKPWMASVYVDADHRNKGVGSELVTSIERIATFLGFQRIYLYTPDRQSFYSRLSWQVLANVDHNGKLVTVMYRTLRPD
jgi:predicted N-acetyltransferase YhbS